MLKKKSIGIKYYSQLNLDKLKNSFAGNYKVFFWYNVMIFKKSCKDLKENPEYTTTEYIHKAVVNFFKNYSKKAEKK